MMAKKTKTPPPPIRYAIRKIAAQTFMVSGPSTWSETSLGGAKLYVKRDSAGEDCEYLNGCSAYRVLYDKKDPVLENGTDEEMREALEAVPDEYEVVTVNLTV